MKTTDMSSYFNNGLKSSKLMSFTSNQIKLIRWIQVYYIIILRTQIPKETFYIGQVIRLD